ncbi:MAG: sigma-70 family RNA polymerase sigma factor [Parabacteroides sp.]|nr:sigma-70 family RNA polymerase sigma factor [Parabacteroides sp.]
MLSERYVQDFMALEALFKRFYKPLRAYAFRFVDDKALAEDIIQDVFYELWQRRESIRFEDVAIKSYLFRAVYTHSLNALNKKPQNVCSLEPEREMDILDQYVSSYIQNSEQSLLLKELEEEIMSYINTLPLNAINIYVKPELWIEKS